MNYLLDHFDEFVGLIFDDEQSKIHTRASVVGLTSVNVIPDNVDNIDVDDNRLNVWVDLVSNKINKFTIG